MQTTEHILFARKGTQTAQKRIDTTWFEYPRSSHSKKPAEIREMIVDVFGDIPRIELFARQKTDGCDIWGNELENDIEIRS